jgi:hypothetical protein
VVHDGERAFLGFAASAARLDRFGVRAGLEYRELIASFMLENA